ncbi:MAG: alpha/beta hydrolase [Saprospiraceae bacterium]|nr:alpha/beta hydrolase [Saprospiraceae bacterium]
MPFINYQQHQIHYYQYGNGDALMFAFHGFADSGNMFEKVARVMYKKYTVIALDLPFHGETLWQGDIYKPEDIQAIISQLMKDMSVDSCSFMCHSMGGRIIWGLLPLMAEYIDQLYFFAPAGFQYAFTASRFFCPLWFRKRARNRYEESEGMLRFFEVTHKLRLMNRATYLVFKQQLDLPRRRARLLQTWISMYYFPMLAGKRHCTLINQNHIACFFFYGKKDRITPAKYSYKFVKQLKKSELALFKGNHFFLRDKLPDQLKDWFSENHLLST